MQIRELTVGPVGTCCYLLFTEDASECIVIDPGAEPSRILKAAGPMKLAAVLLTHGHFDHIGAAAEVKQDDTQLLIHELDAPMLSNPDLNASNLLLRQAVTAPDATCLLHEGDRMVLAGLSVEVLHTPGHTPGSVCYRIEGHLFTGDTLFEHGWGRTDLPGGNEHDLFASLRRLMPMVRTMPFHPGHNA